jgi:flavocytochrome c
MANRVIIIGGGLAGLSAAHSVIERGGSVLLIDKNPFLGGNSVKATSGINGSATTAQSDANIPDTNATFEEDTNTSFHGGQKGPVDPLVKVLTSRSGPAVEWLTSRFGIDLSIVGQLGGHSFPRTHRGKERFPGMTITYALMERLEAIAKADPQQAVILTKSRATRLLTGPDGSVTGVEYESNGAPGLVAEGPVIIATGGFAADFEPTGLLAKYRKDLLSYSTTNGEHCTGDGIKMGEQIGAGLVDMAHVQVHPTGLVHPDEPNAKVKFLAAEALRGTGAIMLNKKGERFCDELGRRDYVSGEMMKNEGPFYLVLNSASSKQIEWHCKHYQGRGLMKFAKTGEELAAIMGVPPAALAATFSAYNKDASAKKDKFGKKFFKSAPFELADNYYVAVIVPIVHYCMGGLKVSPEAEVVNAAGKVIPGLYCAGEAAGGVHGINRLGGNSLLDCVVFGRVAADTACSYILRTSPSRVNVVQSHLEQPKGRSDVLKSTRPSVIKPAPAKEQSLHSGGTMDILPAERAKASFKKELLTNILDGGPEKTKRRKFILSPLKGRDMMPKYSFDRNTSLTECLRHFFEIHDAFPGIVPNNDDVAWMSEHAMHPGTMGNHFALFMSTILGQGSPQQIADFGKLCQEAKVIGAYAQTELGHGSNVRGLQTTSHYDKSRQEFILNTPTLRSIKWWPGTLGKVGTHAVVFAQLILEGNVNQGLHVFIVQIRDEKHQMMPGIELGDLGLKMGDHGNDTGYMIMNNVRVARTAMLARNAWVEPDGKYVVSKEASKNMKATYATMMFTRAYMVRIAGGRLAIAATIATRYSCVRTQGFINTKTKNYLDAEVQLIDHQIQRYRVLKQVAFSFAVKISGKWLMDALDKMAGGELGAKVVDEKMLPEMFTTSAGLKGYVTYRVWEGMEDLRKSCGGNGYLMNSGMTSLPMDYAWQTTAEGDYVVMMLQASRYILKAVKDAREGKLQSKLFDYLLPLGSWLYMGPKIPKGKGPQDYLNLDFLFSLHQAHALHCATGVAMEFAAHTKAKKTNIWNLMALQLQNAVVAHSTQLLVRFFREKVNSEREKSKGAKDALDVVAVLDRLGVLYALSCILDQNWYGVMDSTQMSYAQKATLQVLEKLRPDAVSIVDAFDIPDNVLCSTIGNSDGNVYEALFEATKYSQLNLQDPWVGYEDVLAPRLAKDFLRKGAEDQKARYKAGPASKL